MSKPAKDLGNFNKPVGALALVPKSSQITRVGRQAYNSMLVLAQEQGEGSEYFHAPLNRILTGFAAAKDAAKEVKRHLRSMITTMVEWQSPSPAETILWGGCGLLSEAHLEKVKGEVWVRWAYPPSVRAELLNPKRYRYAQIEMKTIAQLRTHAAVALYEICARYRDNPSGVTSSQHWTWWLPVLTGAPAGSRKTEYRFFKRDYIRPAVDNINEVSELHIEIIEHKLGRSINEIQFSVTLKVPGSAGEGARDHQPVDVSQIVRAQALGLTAAYAEEMHFRYGIDELRSALDALEKRVVLKGQPPVSDPAAYLRTILNSNRASKRELGLKEADSSPSTNPQLTSASASAPPRPAAAQVAPQMPEAREVWEKQRHAQLRQELEDLDPPELDTYLQGLRRLLIEKGGMQSLIRRIDSGNWKSPLVLSELIAYYAKTAHAQDMAERRETAAA